MREEKLITLDQKADADKNRFLKFALSFIGNMAKEFLTLTPENRIKCKQIIFPAGFYVDVNTNVYTPELALLSD